MSTSSILGGDRAAPRAPGHGTDALGPSDSSDSGSDVQGEGVMPTLADNPGELGSMPVELGSDSDAMGTGERGSATGDASDDAADIRPDRIGIDPTYSSQVTDERDPSNDSDADVEGISTVEGDDDLEDEDDAADVAAENAGTPGR